MRIAIASGKGGTGKTTVATSLAQALKNVQYVDCDVEEPNGHLFLKPTIEEQIPVGIPVPQVDVSRCTQCRECSNICEFHAIIVIKDRVLTFPELCHGCGGCSCICPEGAITEVDRVIGTIEIGKASRIDFMHARLNVGEPMAPPLIRKEKSLITNQTTVLLDCPPGTSCPVVESIRGVDYCVLVTEPTPFGLHDLKLAVAMVRELKIPFGVVINVADIGTQDVWDFCAEEDVPVLMTIPYDRKIAEAYSRGTLLVEAFPEYASSFLQMHKHIVSRVTE